MCKHNIIWTSRVYKLNVYVLFTHNDVVFTHPSFGNGMLIPLYVNTFHNCSQVESFLCFDFQLESNFNVWVLTIFKLIKRCSSAMHYFQMKKWLRFELGDRFLRFCSKSKKNLISKEKITTWVFLRHRK